MKEIPQNYGLNYNRQAGGSRLFRNPSRLSFDGRRSLKHLKTWPLKAVVKRAATPLAKFKRLFTEKPGEEQSTRNFKILRDDDLFDNTSKC